MSRATPPQWPDLAGRIAEDGRHLLPIRVYYEDTDAGGVVYHARYLQFCERARSDWLRLLGVHHGELRNDAGERLYFVVRRAECDFLAPARLDDVLQVSSRLERHSPVRLRILQDIRLLRAARETPQTGPIFRARITVAVIGDSGRPARLPGWAMQRLDALSGDN